MLPCGQKRGCGAQPREAMGTRPWMQRGRPPDSEKAVHWARQALDSGQSLLLFSLQSIRLEGKRAPITSPGGKQEHGRQSMGPAAMRRRSQAAGGSSFVPCPACGRLVGALVLDFHLFSKACRRDTAASPVKEQASHAAPTERSREGTPPELPHQRQGPQPQSPSLCDARSAQEATGQDSARKRKREDAAGGRQGLPAGGLGYGASPDAEAGAAGTRDSEGTAREEAPGPSPRPLMALFRRPSKTLWLIRHGHTSFLDPLRPPGPARGEPAARLGSSQDSDLARALSAGGGGGGLDVRLSPLGAQQARALHARFLPLAAEAGLVLVSPLTRALQTLCLALQGPAAAPLHGKVPCPCSARATADAGSARDHAGPHALDPLSCGQEGPKDGVAAAPNGPPADVKLGGTCDGPQARTGQRWRPCPLREEVLREVAFRVVPGAVEHVACSGDVPRPVQEVRREFEYPWLDFSQVPPAPGNAAEGAQRRESRDSLQRRVALFRDYVLALPHARVVVVGHSTFFMELMGSRQRMAHCQVASLRI